MLHYEIQIFKDEDFSKAKTSLDLFEHFGSCDDEAVPFSFKVFDNLQQIHGPESEDNYPLLQALLNKGDGISSEVVNHYLVDLLYRMSGGSFDRQLISSVQEVYDFLDEYGTNDQVQELDIELLLDLL
jgi:hypothetical protein